jgi:predicted secreted protein
MAVRALGTTISIGTTPVLIGGLTEIGGVQLSADTIDVTTLDSDGGYREFIGGFKDAGEVSLSGFFDNTTGNGQAEMYAAFENGTVADFVITFPVALNAKWTFKGVVTGFETSVSFYNSNGNEAKVYMEPGGNLNLFSFQSANIGGTAGVNLIGGLTHSIQIYNYDSAAGAYLIKVRGATKFYDSIGFFGATPIAQKTASYLSGTATLAEVITKINGILGILSQSNYNLVYVT